MEQRYEQIERAAEHCRMNAMLFSAAEKGCLDLVKRLLEARALRSRRATGFGAKPLARAASAGETEIVTLFLDKGAPIDAQSLDGSTALTRRQRPGGCRWCGSWWSAAPTVNLPGRNGITALSAAAYMGSAPIVQLFMEKGADPKAIDTTQKTAIIYAAGRGFFPVVRLLLDHGIDVNAKYGNDLTALMWAAGYSAEAGVERRGGGHDAPDRAGRTPR